MSINLLLLAGELISKSISAVGTQGGKEAEKMQSIFSKVASQPIKMIASFIFAPILILKIAFKVKNPIRRLIAISGIVLSILFSYAAGTILGSMAGFFFVMFHIGFLTACGFLIGTTLSVFLSVTFMLLIFNAVSYLFLKFSQQDIVNYLSELSQ